MQRVRRGVECEDTALGDGPIAARGSKVVITYTFSLNKGEVLESDIRCEFRLGARHVVAGLEYGVEGMRVGGERRIRAGPHLAYGSKPVAGKIPANAVLEFRAKLVSAEPAKDGDAS